MSDILDVNTIPSRNVMVHDPSGQNKHAEYLRNLILQHSPETILELMSWCLPGDAEPQRLGSTMGSRRTAIANPKEPITVLYPTGNTNSDLTTDTTMGFKFADVLRSFVYNRGLTNTEVFEYLSHFKVDIPDFPSEMYPDYSAGGDRAFSSQKPFAPHGEALYLGRVGDTDQHRAFLLTQGNVASIQFDGIPMGRTITAVLKRLNGAKWEVSAQIDFVGTGAAQVGDFGIVADTDYYAITFSQTTNQAVGVAGLTGFITLVGNGGIGLGGLASLVNGSMWCQLTTAQFHEVDDAVNSDHVNGCSLMYTNTSPVAYRLGQTVMLQLPSESNWLDYTNFDQITRDKDSGLIEAVIGAYVFRKPNSFQELEMVAPSRGGTVSGTAEIDYSFELFPIASPIVISSKVVASAPSGQAGYWTSCDVVEFSTLNQWINTTTKRVLPNDLDSFLAKLSDIPQYHTNEFHFSDIWDGITSFFGGVWDVVKEVAPVVGPLIPLLLQPKGNPNSVPGSKSSVAPRPSMEGLGNVSAATKALASRFGGGTAKALVASLSAIPKPHIGPKPSPAKPKHTAVPKPAPAKTKAGPKPVLKSSAKPAPPSAKAAKKK